MKQSQRLIPKKIYYVLKNFQLNKNVIEIS